MSKLLLFLALSWCGTALAHELQHSVESAGAVVLHLNYADGKPFSFEAYELYADGERIPAQVGRTDAQGRVVFLPGAAKQWRARAFSADGHGVDLRFDAPAVAGQGAIPATQANRLSLVLFGVSLLLGGFGLYQLFLRRKSS